MFLRVYIRLIHI